MKNKKFIPLICFALLITAGAAAQDFKPVKDKATKKYGYQAKDKSWVIEPAFDKANRFSDGFAVVEVQGLQGLIDQEGNWVLEPEYSKIDKFNNAGLCEVTVKNGRDKFYGVADKTGRLVIPTDCSGISINTRNNIIHARRSSSEELGGAALWGVYSVDGDEIFAPQFNSQPSWRNGYAAAKSAYNGLEGLITADGAVPIPFENIKVEVSSGGVRVLTSDFSTVTYDSRLQRTGLERSPGSVIPYDPMDDDIRLAAWHAGCIGKRLHSNNVLAATVVRDAYGRSAQTSLLRLDWGHDRFLRLEPVEDTQNHPGSMEDTRNGNYYTIRAIMYEADGSNADVVSSWGWIDSVFDQGIIYRAEGEQDWLILNDINYPASRQGTVPLSGYRPANNDSVASGLGIMNSDINSYSKPGKRADRIRAIYEGENVGINSYLLRKTPIESVRRAENEVMRSPLFRHKYFMGDIVNCTLKQTSQGVEVRLENQLKCNFTDVFEDPDYKMEGSDEIFWGPWNRNFVMLCMEALDSHDKLTGISDDVHGTDLSYKIVLCMFDENGRYIRTIAEAPAPDYANDEIIVWERLGIAAVNAGYNRLGSETRYGTDSRYDSGYNTGSRYASESFKSLIIKEKEKMPAKLSSLEAATGGMKN